MRIFVFLYSILLLCSGCANRHYTYSGLNEIEASGSFAGESLDSLVKEYKEAIVSSEEYNHNMDMTFTTIEYSKPDSFGNQYKIKETIGTVKKESSQSKDSSKITESTEQSISISDSASNSNIIQKTQENETYEKEGINRFVAPLAALLFVAGMIYLAWPRIKDLIK